MLFREAKSKKPVFFKILLAVIFFTVIVLAIYLTNYHSGNEYAKNLLTSPSNGVSVITSDNTISFIPKEKTTKAVIFYPGAKITADAYTPIANNLAENGYMCILVQMPLNMSFLDYDAAIDEMDKWPEIETWYIAGHSLGGYAAENCVYENPDTFSGLIILASRIKVDLSESGLPVLGIYGTEDGICKPEYILETIDNLPSNIKVEFIEGGCHGYFGFYGSQFMDGNPTISQDEQFNKTMSLITEFLNQQ